MRRKLSLALVVILLAVTSMGVFLLVHGHAGAQVSDASSTGRLLGIKYDHQTMPATTELSVIDPTTGTQAAISPDLGTVVPGIGMTPGVAALDSAGHRYFVEGIDPNDNRLLFTIDTQTGAIGAPQTLFANGGGLYTSLAFDPSTGRLLGIRANRQTTPATIDLTAIDPTTGTQAAISPDLGTIVPGIGMTPGVAALDSAGHRYFAVGFDMNGDALLLTVDTQTGAILAPQTLFAGGGIDNSLAFEAAPPTPQQQLQALSSQVQALTTSGALSTGNADALQASLTAASNSLAQGNSSSTCNQLGAFVNKVNALVQSGRLTVAQGSALTGSAKSLMSEVCS